jgi:outer membrane protein assembly factor BamB
MMTIMNTHTYRCRPRARAAGDLSSFPSVAWLGLCCGLAATWGGSLSAADWPQYRGPTHDGKTSERLLKTWPTGGLKQVWKVPTTDGFSVFSVGHGRAFTLVARELDGVRREVCLALDADTGKELWAAPLGAAKYDGGGDRGASDNQGGDGPRSTPTVDGDRVYVLDAHLLLVCLEAKTGKRLWSNDLVTSMGARNIDWQNAASPVLDGDAVFVCCGAPGQSLVAFNKRDGSVLWKGENDAMTHASPVPATIHGVRQVIFFTQPGLVSVDAKTGKVLWRYGFRYSVSTAASPIVADDIVYCSAGYGVGSAAVRIQKNGADFSATELWRLTGNKVANHWSTPVLKDGHLYGMFSFKEFGTGALKCVELATGKEVWAQPQFGPGGVVLADGVLLALSDRGELVLVDPSPAGYKELARTQAVTGKCWNHPVVSGGRIYARSTKEAVCLEAAPQTSTR